MKRVKVVGAVIENERKEILAALRSPRMTLPNLWEFPGGKVEDGESSEEALIREIKEELGCTIEVFELIEDVVHEYPKVFVNLLTFKARIVDGKPTAKEHSKLEWTSFEALQDLEWAPADIPTIDHLLNQQK
ncbi:(deoxy)nucleoside triphosphate pyrophosphohydrolase [Evansella sp. AB-P1]|uniref:(deoxy)nucleoside triphosphate pyrophosphohydrolase n=1 Tax=Evansella sp. AB-P1 TaxID=3037653 RepID=UPI00241E1E1A|nr:(deoxy)nucleoside triphosphate pyrophosphohydrolase [Evansella sp. AB-P1]MDG5790140.1 (deoxy)nucleoside triphosphate pyrophosphohydrolase [Evansella sp. AB-P1]